MSGGRALLAHPEACIWCSQCEQICPTDAIGLPYLIRFDTGPTADEAGARAAPSHPL